MILLTGLLAMTISYGAETSISVDQSTVRMQNRQTATATVTQEMGLVQLEPEKHGLGDFLALNWGVLSLSL